MTRASRLAHCISVILLAAVGTAVAEQTYRLDIPSQPVAEALKRFAEQSGLQVVYYSKVTEGQVAKRVAGTLPAREALGLLLEGTGLTFQAVDESTVAIVKPQASSKAATNSLADKTGSFRIARLQGDRSVGEAPTTLPQGTRPAAAEDREEVEQKREEVEEIVVTGTHIRGAPATSDIIEIDRADIERAGFTTVDTLMASVPENFNEISAGGYFAAGDGSVLGAQNDDRVTSVNLRGLGAQSTLALVNGVRVAGSIGGRVLDISMLPLSMIERVDVVTGGHAAIYGADAVAGVVNFVTRQGFSGVQAEASYGLARGGGEQLQAGILGGVESSKGGFVVGYDSLREWPFDLADVGLLSGEFSPNGYTTKSLEVQSASRRHSGFFSGGYRPSSRIAFSGHAFYTDKNFDSQLAYIYPDALEDSWARSRHPSSLYSTSLGTEISLTRTWTLDITASHSVSTNEQHGDTLDDDGFFISTSDYSREEQADVTQLSAVVDGQLFELAGSPVRAAIGAEFREEGYSSTQEGTLNGEPYLSAASDDNRNVRSVFAEVVLPLVTNGSNPLLRRVELSAAVRYDDYSDFGDTTNPRLGVLWRLTPSVSVRAGYSKAFRAPALVELTEWQGAGIFDVADPTSETGIRPVLIPYGNNSSVGPETADTWSVGLELRPESLPSTSVSLTYFNARYEDRLEMPASNEDLLTVLESEQLYPGLIDRSPDVAATQAAIERYRASLGFASHSAIPFDPESQNVFDVFPDLVVFDNRTQNIAVERVSGLDLIFEHSIVTPVGELSAGANLSYVLRHDRRITVTSPPIDAVNAPGKPVDFRARANVGWSNGAYGLFGYVNYLGSYTDPRVTPRDRIESWTTVDLTGQLDCEKLAGGGFLRGLSVSLSIQNVLDRGPPRYATSNYGALYDPANADPFGRFVSLRAVLKW
jgi:iron complex outermembrane recepter protein